MEGSTVDAKESPTLDAVLSNLRGVPNMVETMALMEDMVGLTLTKTSESLVHSGGATILDHGVMVVGLRISAMKDTVEFVVEEVGPSINKGGVMIPNVGLSGQNTEKVGVMPLAFWQKAARRVDIWQREN